MYSQFCIKSYHHGVRINISYLWRVMTRETHELCDCDSDWYTVLTYATKLASCLVSLHEKEITHQDLHPGNVALHQDII
ncbi:hypothetical protein BC937DRAFT_91089 [Endogone sp. FLAS-F59071]|nr:hypothetical protein BC937DRAFT_91089 [Endogone sp. FLAS-F59071]|eukprot:RUS16542.1 hypothetical protein BC937DRAFT_91089 [Endogone sp. FLAS-F59071]